jgi:subfamily B ATP-binding cassette protein HlyB/CyaB
LGIGQHSLIMDTTHGQAQAPDTGLQCAVLLARFHGCSADYAALHHQFSHHRPGHPEIAVLLALRHLKLKARTRTTTWKKLQALQMPLIAQDHEGHFFVVAALKDDQVMIQRPGNPRSDMLTPADFQALWNGRVILAAKRARLADGSGRFDFSWFIPAILKYRKLFYEVLVASLFLQLFALITPLFFQVVIDKVLVHKGLTTLHILAIGLLTLALFEALLGGLRTYLFSHTTNRIDVMLGAKLYQHLLALPIAYFDARRVGDSVARVRELETIRNFLTGSSLTLVVDLLFTFVFFIVMYAYSPLLTGVVAGAIPFYILLSVIVTPILRRRLNEKFSRGAENQAFLVESVTGVHTVKALSLEPQLQKQWEEQLAGYVRSAFRAANLGNIASQIAGLINKVTIALILWVGAQEVITGGLSVGQLVAFNMLAARVSGPVLRLVQLWQDFQQAGISVQRLGDILNTQSERPTTTAVSALPAMQGRLTFEHVGFRYRPDAPEALHDINLDIAPGEVVGIVGASGSGKSTLTRLVQRLYVPQQGRVLVDGSDLSLIDPVWLRRQSGVVLQDNYLFNRSIRDNIALADPGMANERVIEAATLVGAHEFILALPEGYDTLVGEHGSTLSGGQRQRIAFARALVTDPRLLILDEATSALDYESERVIRNNLPAICCHRTVLIIAHRLSTVRDADRIVVIDKGHVAEQGSHEALITLNGLYARMVEYQSQ